MSKLQKDFGEQYLVKQFQKELDSDSFSSNDINIQIENEARGLELIQIKQEHEVKLLKIKKDYEESMLKIQQ